MSGLVDACRAHAAAGDWRALCHTLSGRSDEAAQSSTLIPLYAEALMRVGDPRAARSWLRDRHERLQQHGDRSAIRRASNLAGAASLELGEVDAAQAEFERALELARHDDDDLLIARVTNNLAVIAAVRGRHTEALGLYAAAVPAYQRIGNVNGIAESHHNAAIALRKLQRLNEAEDQERRAADFARRVPNPRLLAITMVGRAEIALLRGDAALANAAAQRAARALAAVPDPARQADALRLSGMALFTLRDDGPAREALDRAVALASAHGSGLIEAESRWARAQVADASGDTPTAKADARLASSLFQQLGAASEFALVRAWMVART